MRDKLEDSSPKIKILHTVSNGDGDEEQQLRFLFIG